MEIDSPNIENILEKYYYELLFPNQNYKLCTEYKLWKKNVEDKFGRNGKELFCKKDNIIIYQSEQNINFGIFCPICNRALYICNFCNKTKNQMTKRCCFKAYINDILFNRNKLYKFIIIENEENKRDFYYSIFINFIPFAFVCQNILMGMFLFFANLENKRNEIIDDAIDEMNTILKIIYVIVSIFYVLSMIIAYTFFFYSIYLIILILSIPFKFYPIKLLLGFYCSILH